MKPILISIVFSMISFTIHAQCNPKVKVQVPEGYTLIRELKVDMLGAKNNMQNYYFTLKEKQEYQILIVEDPAYKSIASYNLYENNIMLGTNYNSKNSKFYDSYNFICQSSKDYKIEIIKEKNTGYCGSFYLLVKTNGQDPSTLKNEHLNRPEVFVIVEKMPIFKNGQGISEFKKWVAENVKYPVETKEKGKSGRVYVQFIVNTQGQVIDAKVAKSTNPIFEKAAVDVVMSSPVWESPGTQRGVKVNIQYFIPVDFK